MKVMRNSAHAYRRCADVLKLGRGGELQMTTVFHEIGDPIVKDHQLAFIAE
jgi:hypothetical protein